MAKKKQRKNIVIVMPAYNVEKTIASVFRRIPAKIYQKVAHIVVVDDGSKDNTRHLAEQIAKKYQKIAIVPHQQNRGYGAAQKTGHRKALMLGADIVVLLHSDGQYSPEIMNALLKPLEAGTADIVLGSRMMKAGAALKGGMPMYKYLGNKFLTMLENMAYGLRLSEYHSGYMLYNRKALETIPFERLSERFHFDGEMLLMAAKKKLRVTELPIPTYYGGEKSNLNAITYGLDVLKIIWRNFRGKYDF